MIDGFYRMAFTGTAGSGFGMLAFLGGKIAGADISGASYDGSYSDDPTTKEISFQVTMAAPAGITPVQTGIPLIAPASFPITGKFRPDDLATEKPFLLQTPLGPVNVIFKKIRDIP